MSRVLESVRLGHLRPAAGLSSPDATAWVISRTGRPLLLRIRELEDGRTAYVPARPVLALELDGSAACALKLLLRSSPSVETDIVSLVDKGRLDLTLSLDLGLPLPYAPAFIRHGVFTLRIGDTQLQRREASGSGVSASFGLNLTRDQAVPTLLSITDPYRSPEVLVTSQLELADWDGVEARISTREALGVLVGDHCQDGERERLVELLQPRGDGLGYEPIPRRVKVRRARGATRDPRSTPVMLAGHTVATMASLTAPHPVAAINAHALMHASGAAPAAVHPGVSTAVLHDISIVSGLQSVSNAQEHLPQVADVAAHVFPDHSDPHVYWYPPSFDLKPPGPAEAADSSSFELVFTRTGMSPGPPPRPTLAGEVRFELTVGMSAATRAALEKLGSPKALPLPLDRLAVTLEVPYMEGGVPKTQSLPASVELRGAAVTATVALLDDGLRMAYGALAFPDTFQAQPCRLRVGYSFTAYAPFVPGLSPLLFGGKIAAIRPDIVGRIARQSREARATLAVKPPLVLASSALHVVAQKRYVKRTIGRDQAIELRLDCSTYGRLYEERTTQGLKPIGCTDALKLGEFKVMLYRELQQFSRPQWRVYQSLAQPDVYLVVPTAYRVSRFGPQAGEEKAYRPTIVLYSVLDTDPDQSRFFFSAVLEPDIAFDARMELEAALAAQAPKGSTLRIQYPTELQDAGEPVIEWTVPAELDQPTMALLPQGFSLGISTRLTSGLLLLNVIQANGLIGAVTMTLPDGMVLRSSLVLDTVIGGPWETGPLDVLVDAAAGHATITNRIDTPADLLDLVLVTGGVKSSVPVNTRLEAGKAVQVPIQKAPELAWCTYASSTTARPIQELRVFVEDVTTDVTFINQAQLDQHGFDGLAAEVRFVGSDQVYRADDASGPSTSLTLTLPLTTYLDPHSIEYRFEARRQGGGAATSPWRVVDLTRTSVIGITPDLLPT